MIFLACILGVAVGFIRGGRFASILHKRFRLWPLLFIAFFCEQLLSSALIADKLASWSGYGFTRFFLALIQYLLVGIFLFVNWKKPGMVIALAGSSLNGLVIVANQGRMPISASVERFGPEAIEKIVSAPHYFLASGDEPFLVFGDTIQAWIYMISIGDILISLGLFWLGTYLPKRIRRPKPKTAVEDPRDIGYTDGR